MIQMTVRERNNAIELSFLAPHLSIAAHQVVRTTIGIAEMDPEKKFDLIAANFSRMMLELPKNIVKKYAKRDPIVNTTPPRETGEQYARILHIPSTPNPLAPTTFSSTLPQHDGTYALVSPKPRHLDLTHKQEKNVEAWIFTMLQKNALMQNDNLGAIKTMEHRIDLEPRAKPVGLMPYRHGPAIREHTKAKVDNTLKACIVEPPTSEWAAQVFFASKKDGTLRPFVGYSLLSTGTFPDTYALPRVDHCNDYLGYAAVFSMLDCSSAY